MSKPMIRLMSHLLVAGISIGAASQTHAGQTITVNFSGQGEGTTLGLATFSGTFKYDQAQGGTSSGSGNTFSFTSSTVVHSISYQLGTSSPSSGSGLTCQPFTINTSGYLFQLQATPKVPTTTTVAITIPSPASLTSGTSSLPSCQTSSGAGVFPSTALPGSTFTVLANGVMTFSGTITSLSCSPETHSAEITRPTSQAPQHLNAAVASAQYAPYLPEQHAPAQYAQYAPVYVCQPRPTCCVSRLFCRGSLRLGCH
jgi:hypothetical protein